MDETSDRRLRARRGGVDRRRRHNSSCAQLVQQINALQTSVATNAAAYWAHRANFIELQNGQSRSIVPDASAMAQQEQSAAAPLKAGMPSRPGNPQIAGSNCEVSELPAHWSAPSN